MNIENMNKLITHLEWLRDNDKAYKFNMRAWFTVRDEEEMSIFTEAATIQGLRNIIRQHEHTFEPSATECGTVACLAGHAALIGGARENDLASSFAREWLELEYEEATLLFFGHWTTKPRRDITLDDAITHLKTLVTWETQDRAREANLG